MQFEEIKNKVVSAWSHYRVWQLQNINDKRFIYVLSVVIGLISGLVAVLLKNTVMLVEYILTNGIRHVDSYLFFLYPFLGIVFTVLFLVFVVRKTVGHGIPNTLFAISKGNGNMKFHESWSTVIAAALTVGTGGSAGLESPAVNTSAALSSNLGRRLKLTRKTKVLFIACAASGALSGIFNAPVAAIVFALEVIMIDLTAVSLVPLLLSSVAATLTGRILLGEETLFPYKFIEPFSLSQIGLYIVLGVACGMMSVYFSKVYFTVGEWISPLKNKVLKALIGGAATGLLIYLFPSLYGEGYLIINSLIEGAEEVVLSSVTLFHADKNVWLATGVFLVLLLIKPVATSLTIHSGGIGGIFAPALFIGSVLGYVFSKIIQNLGFDTPASGNFTLVAMGGMMAGMLHAPLTGIFLIAEITGGYELFIPLMLTTAITFITVKYATPHSVYNQQLMQKGQLVTLHKDQAVLTLMNLNQEIERDFVVVRPYDKLRDLVQAISKSSRNLFPVNDEQGRFLGVITLNEVREIMFERDKYEEVNIHELMSSAPETVEITNRMEDVMRKFDDSGAWNLPVLDEEGKYIGFVSKSKLFSGYREKLREFYDDSH